MENFYDDRNKKPYTELIERFEEMQRSNRSYYFDMDDFVILADYYLTMDDINTTMKVIQTALSQHDTNSIILIKKAQVYALSKRTKEALNILDEAESIDPLNKEIYIARGAIYSQLKNHRQAIKEYEKASYDNEDLDEIYTNIAIEYENMIEYESALFYFKKALQANPLNQDIIHELDFCYACVGTHYDAIDFYEKYLNDYPYSLNAWLSLGTAYKNVSRLTDSIKAFDFCIAINPNFMPAHISKASCLYDMGHYKQSIQLYKSCIDFKPDETSISYNIGEYGKKQNKSNVSNNLDEESFLSEALMGLGICYKQMGMLNTAHDYMEEAVCEDPLVTDYWHALGAIENLLKDYDAAIISLNTAKDLNPEDVDINSDLGDAYFFKNDLETARKYWEIGYTVNSHNSIFAYKLAALALTCNNEQQALKLIKEAYSQDPDKYEEVAKTFPILKENDAINKFVSKQNTKQ